MRYRYHEEHKHCFEILKPEDVTTANVMGLQKIQYGIWCTDDHVLALNLFDKLDDEGQVRILHHTKAAAQAMTASSATSCVFKCKETKGMNRFPYQHAGVRELLLRGNTLLADPIGLGKTAQAIGLIDEVHAAQVLIVCLASLKGNWANELDLWLESDLSYGIATGKEWPDTDIVIINYDILKKHRVKLQATRWSVIIVDECHYCKNPQAQRTKEVVALSGQYKVAMSGTPVVNKPADLHCILKWLDPKRWRNRTQYLNRYCNPRMIKVNGRNIWLYDGCTKGDELQKRLRSTVMVRRRKDLVLSQLPPKQRQIIDLDVSYPNLTKVRKWLCNLFGGESRLLSDDEFRAIVSSSAGGIDELPFGSISEIRREAGEAKVPAVIEHLRDAIDSSGKVVCFAHHRSVIDRIYEAFSEEAVKLTGDTPVNRRQEAVAKFQIDPDISLFIGNIQAAGVGITLTSASHVVFAEASWVSGELIQAEDRCHRIGQNNNVLIQYLVVKDSIDSNVLRTVVYKQNNIDTVMEGE